MCGIAGILTTNASRPDEARLRGMAEAIRHRGPDGEGIWTDEGVGLVHRRLAIIDLSDRGVQPMRDRSGVLSITFNGEIYNYKELREEIGADWRTESDTEVILEGYKKWGDDVVKKLRGMFAFVLWDGEKRRALLARDRIGKKPLFYSTLEDGSLAFGSELKVFRSVRELKADPLAIRLFLGLQYVPTPRTGFLGIEQLAPGHVGVFQEGTFTTRPYHEWVSGSCALSRTEMDQRIRTLLEESVKIRQLASDVPVGAFLSGGVDSAAIVAYAVKHAERLQTFTMGFANAPKMDERTEAAEIAKHFGTVHHAFEAKPDDLLNLIDELVTHYDAPYADSSALPLWLLARETAQKIKVVLTGDGGDELFGGYRRYVAYQRAMNLPRLTAPLARAIGSLTGDARYGRMAQVIESQSYGEMFCGSYFGSADVAELLQKNFLHETSAAEAVHYVDAMTKTTDLSAAMRFDLTSYLPDDLNVKMDRATMRFGLEARSPFLDQQLVEFAISLPLNEKVKHGKTKIALKRALQGVVPHEVLNRPKRGFQVPLATWFRGPLKHLVEERLTSGPITTIVRSETVRRLIDENARGVDHGNRLWMLLSLSSWISRYGI